MTFEYRSIRPYKWQTVRQYANQTDIKPKMDLVAPFKILYKSGLLVVEKGAPWDGPTGALDTEDFMEASLVHDMLCEFIHDDGLLDVTYRPLVDLYLEKMLVEVNMPRVRRKLVMGAIHVYVLARYGQKPIDIIP